MNVIKELNQEAKQIWPKRQMSIKPKMMVLLPDEVRRLEGISIKQPFQFHNRVDVGSVPATWMCVYRYMRPRTGSCGDA